MSPAPETIANPPADPTFKAREDRAARTVAAIDGAIGKALSDHMAKQTTFSRAAAKVALAAALRPTKDTAGSVLCNVLVHEMVTIATDGRRAVIIKAQGAGGMFDKNERIALIPRERLADVQRGTVDHINVTEHGALEGMDDEGELVRSCPFTPPVLADYPDVVAVLENRTARKLVCRFAPRLLGELLMAMAAAGCEKVSLYDAGPSDVALEFRGEIDHEVEVSALIARVTHEQDAPLPVPQPERGQSPGAGPMDALNKLESELDRKPPAPMTKDEIDRDIGKLADAATGKGKRRKAAK